jgi:hypothetical protein
VLRLRDECVTLQWPWVKRRSPSCMKGNCVKVVARRDLAEKRRLELPLEMADGLTGQGPRVAFRAEGRISNTQVKSRQR